MLMTVLFYIIAVCLALVLIGWSASELMHIWQAGAVMSLVYLLTAVVMIVRLVIVCVRGDALTSGGAWCIFALTLVVAALYMHFRLFGTMIVPLSALVLLILEMCLYLGKLPGINFWLPMVYRTLAPWGKSAVVLMMIGLGIAVACLLLAVPTWWRVRNLAAREAAEAAKDDAAAENDEPLSEAAIRARMLQKQTDDVTRKMPRVLSHFAWWALAVLSFALGAYVLWCHTLYGVYWLWQPVTALAVVAWVLLFIGKDMLFARTH